MLKAARRSGEGWFNNQSIEKFSCWDLKKIDDLWMTYSNKRFGFRTQLFHYLDTGNKPGVYNKETWQQFEERVGWRDQGGEVGKNKLTFNLSAPKGHLPAADTFYWRYGGDTGLGPMIALRTQQCYQL